MKSTSIPCPLTRARKLLGRPSRQPPRCKRFTAAARQSSFADLEDGRDPLAFVLSENLFRRHLDKSDKAIVGHYLQAGSRPGRTPVDRKGANLPYYLTQQEAAKKVGVSVRSIKHAARVFSADSAAADELRRAVEDRKIKVSDASAVVNRPPEMQRGALEMVIAGKAKTVRSAVRRLEAGGPTDGGGR